MAKIFRALNIFALIAFFICTAAGTAADKPFDPCSLLTPADIQAIVGKPIQTGTPKTGPNQLTGANCTYVIDGAGSLNVLVKPLQTGETPAVMKTQFAKMKMNPTDLPKVGDASFFTSPGYGMVQLHTFKGSKYILITLLVPGLEEKTVRPLAEKLMLKLLPKLQ